jgi:hypothetical protein
MGRKTGKGSGTPTASTLQSGGATATAPRPTETKARQATTGQNVTLSYEQVAQRAREIWIQKGCKPGQDEQNWLEAEAQLRAEAARK